MVNYKTFSIKLVILFNTCCFLRNELMLWNRYKDRIRLYTFIYLFCLNYNYMSSYMF